MFSLEATTAWHESQTIDEAVHLSAGFSYLKTGDFRLNPEHPPLVKELAALPLLFTPVRFPSNDITWHTWDQYKLGAKFLYDNALSARTILFLGRLPIMLISLLLGWWIFRASKKLFGSWGGVISLSLYTLDPGFIAHGHLVTTDVAFTAFSFWTILRLIKLLEQPTKRHALMFALAMWIAGLSKFSMLPYLAIIVIVMLLLKLREPKHLVLQIKRGLKVFFICLPVVILLTWAFYGFDIRRPSNDPRIGQLYSQRLDYLATHSTANLPSIIRFVVNTVGNTSTPLGSWLQHADTIVVPGYAFFRGAIAVIGHSIGGQEAYLHGEFRDRGWWYYFPITIAIKSTLPTLFAGLAVLTIVAIWITRARRRGWSWRRIYTESDRTWFIFLTVPILFLASTMTSHLNLGWRYVLPAYPFLFVLAGALASEKVIASRRWRLAMPALFLTSMIVVQLNTFPNELGYFNSLIGGSKNGPSWLLDSNLDWGQDLPSLADFVKQHHLSSIPLSYYGWAKVDAFVATTHLPTTAEINSGTTIHGYVAISVGQLYNHAGTYSWLHNLTPAAKSGPSIYIYQLP